MTIAATTTLLRSGGVDLDTSPDHFGTLLDSSDLLTNPAALHQRINRDGYLYLPGLLEPQKVLAVRRHVTDRLAAGGFIKPGTDPMDAIMNPGSAEQGRRFNMMDLAKDNPPLSDLLYTGTLMSFFHHFLAGPVRHFDYTWFRAIKPGKGTPCHLDSVYMNRGTQNLFTTWIPMGDVDLALGGLMVLEGSNNNTRLRETYGKQDVDAVCQNRPDAKRWGRHDGSSGWLAGNVNQIRRSLAPRGKEAGGAEGGGRWLTAEFKTGDAVIFTIHTLHCSLDNQTPDRYRFSSDSRYQLASEPADERWIGETPPGHGPAGKRDKIC
jgi:hypothetical protein